MIVKNEESRLPTCLGSVREFVDEIILADTGSTDRTVEIAQSLGATVVSFTPDQFPDAFMMDDGTQAPGLAPYTGKLMLADFAAARNFAFQHATGDFIMWIDADDTVQGADKLRFVVNKMAMKGWKSVAFFYDYGDNIQFFRERIVRRDAGFKWVGVVHESLCIAEQRSDEVVIFHARGERVKNNRNLKIMTRERERKTISDRLLFYLAGELRYGDKDKAEVVYREYLERPLTWVLERATAHVYLGQCLERRGTYGAAKSEYAAATIEDENLPEAWFGLGRCNYFWKDWHRCIGYMERGLDILRKKKATALFVEPAERTFRPLLYYNRALGEVGRYKEALSVAKQGLAMAEAGGASAVDIKMFNDNIEFFTKKLGGAPALHPVPVRSIDAMKIHAIIPSRLAVNPNEAGNLFLDRALRSLSAQTRKPDKVIVGVDPGMLAKVPPRLLGDWVQFVEASLPGQAHALQAATDASDADVLVYLEDDDQREPPAIEIAMKVLAEGADMVTSNQREVTMSGDFARYNDFATPSGWTVKRSAIEKAGGWDTSYRWHVDNAILGRLHKAEVKREHLVEAGGSKTQDPSRMQWLGNVAHFSGIVETTCREPLVTRCLHDGSGMARIAVDNGLAKESAEEYARLVAEFGHIPW